MDRFCISKVGQDFVQQELLLESKAQNNCFRGEKNELSWKKKLNLIFYNRKKNINFFKKKLKKNQYALTGNRIRASRVAGENSTTEPSVHIH